MWQGCVLTPFHGPVVDYLSAIRACSLAMAVLVLRWRGVIFLLFGVVRQKNCHALTNTASPPKLMRMRRIGRHENQRISNYRFIKSEMQT